LVPAFLAILVLCSQWVRFAPRLMGILHSMQVVVSHSQDFLNGVCTNIMNLTNKKKVRARHFISHECHCLPENLL
jgi:hypothetical protein